MQDTHTPQADPQEVKLVDALIWNYREADWSRCGQTDPTLQADGSAVTSALAIWARLSGRSVGMRISVGRDRQRKGFPD